MLTKIFDCHKKCDTIREIKLRRGSGLLEQCDAREARLARGLGMDDHWFGLGDRGRCTPPSTKRQTYPQLGRRAHKMRANLELDCGRQPMIIKSGWEEPPRDVRQPLAFGP